MRAVVRGAAAVVAWGLAGSGCDVPAVREPREGPRLVASSPGAGAQDVDRLPEIRLVFERPLLPRSVGDETVAVRSGSRRVAIVARADPLLPGIAISVRQVLDPDVRYEVRVEGVRDLDGREAPPVSIRFVTGETVTDPPPAPAPPWSEVGPLLEDACGGCHGGADPLLGLDLASVEGVRRTAIGVPAVEVAGLPSGPSAARTAGLIGMARIAAAAGAGRPEESYLVYKLLGDPHVVGERMPPPADGGAGGLDREAIRFIAWWIAAGAPTDAADTRGSPMGRTP